MIADIRITEKSFVAKNLMHDVHFSISDGEKVGLIGRNGVGKTTLFGILSGEDQDYSGEIIFRRGTIVAKTAQEHSNINPRQTVVEYILNGLPEFAKLDRIIREFSENQNSGENNVVILSAAKDLARKSAKKSQQNVSSLAHVDDNSRENSTINFHKIQEYTDALQRFTDLGYFEIREKVARELANFQMADRADEPFAKLSGGQKRLAEIVKIMHSNAHLALIDEPTNHMDFVAKQQFIDWLKNAREAVLVITHDRDVLREVDRIVELKDGGAVSYPGNYDAYLAQNASHTATDLNDYENVQRQMENLRKRIQYARSKKASWGGTADKRNPFVVMENRAEKELAELAKAEKPSFWIDRESAAELDHKSAARYAKFKSRNIRLAGINTDDSKSRRVLISAKNLSLGYEFPLFSNVNFDLRENSAIELRGRNGAGKTTLIRAILENFDNQATAKPPRTAFGNNLHDSRKTPNPVIASAAKQSRIENSRNSDLTIFSGELSVDHHMKIGVYNQEIDTKYFDLPLFDAIERLYLDKKLPISREKIMRLMSDYLFDPLGDSMIHLANLSGGQKARFQLIAMLAENPQLLILDEPTNHLDLPSIEELETALAKYSGAILYVSHDGYFRTKIGGEVVKIGGQ